MALPRRALSPLALFADFLGGSVIPRQRCLACHRRTFSSATSLRQSPRRQLQTASAYQPSTLPTDLSLPPRNVGIPDTSIAGGLPPSSSNSTKTFKASTISSWGDNTDISLPEREAQKSDAAGAPATETSASLSPAPAGKARRSRFTFKARKATITLTPKAIQHLRALLDQPEPKLIRVGTKAKGCSGLSYDLEYVDKPSPLDESIEQDGVKVLIDNKALMNIIGSEMDWAEDKLSARFVFRNPNITESCGCGESFSVK